MIQANDLSFYYKKASTLYDGVTLTIGEGRIVGLLGKNGAGKSTLFGLICGLIHPRSGSIEVNGYIPSERDPRFLQEIYMVPEEFSFPHITIATYVSAYAPLYSSFDREKLKEILQEFELDSKAQLNKLSHGQRKKFLIAFALATNSRILLFDEPTNGLDIPSKSQFRKILVSSVTDQQLVLISTHQVKDIDTIIDQIVVVNEGKIVYQESTEDITRRLRFDIIPTLTGADGVIHHERCAMGHRVIVPATKGHESDIDLELLFNAIINKSIKTEKCYEEE
jgi:ABC-type multidrug transport system, ATPase component